MLPLGTDRALRRPTVATFNLIGVCLLVYVAELVLKLSNPDALARMMDLLQLRGPLPRPWTFITYAFLHDVGSPFHVLGNILFLWVFGPCVEDRFGRAWFTVFYLAGAAVAGAAHLLEEPRIGVIGASGAVSAVAGAFLVLFPRTRVRIIFIGLASIPAWWFIVFCIVRDFVPMSIGYNSGISYAAHLGGYALGISVALVLLWMRVIPREPYDLLTIFRQARRRRQIAAAVGSSQRARPGPVRRDPHPTERDQPVPAVAEARARVSALLAGQDLEGAAREYRSLVGRFGDVPGAATLSARNQLDLANHLFREGDHAGAAAAYERYLGAYPTDGQAPNTQLMLALVKGRYLADAPGAIDLLRAAQPRLDDEHRAIADDLLAELGAGETASGRTG